MASLNTFLNKIFGSSNDRNLRKFKKRLEEINALEPVYEKLADQELVNKTNFFKEKLKNDASLDEILNDAFAVVREASKRTLGERHFDVQLIGGMVLHQGKIAEMKTGEGKTLVSTLPTFLNALTGKGVHVVTVNDYLARRDAEWMGQVHRFLGLSVGLIQQQMLPLERKKNYECDITYATNSELGFDYLRDNMAADKSEIVQRSFQFSKR